jgi:molybdopterin-synthase adenylyltransferase
MSGMPESLARYARQVRFPPLGEEGQRRLGESRALLCGCGALGSAIADMLVRAGIGLLRIVDRDFVELSNLQRQTLFDEADAAAGLPKAIAAAEKLRRINSTVTVEPVVADIDPANIEQFCVGMDAILDGTDNFETRFLINDAAVKLNLPWVYGGCVAAEGQSMTVLPGETPCLRCLMPDCPPPGSTPTCDVAGILGPIVGLVASIEAAEAIKILSGNRESISRSLTVVDLWPDIKPRPVVAPEPATAGGDRMGATTGREAECATTGRGFMEPIFRQIDVRGLRELVDCPTCKGREFAWLAGVSGSRTAVLCGRNAVQLSHLGAAVSLDDLARRLEGLGQLTRNQFLLRLRVEGYELTIFDDGRAIISGTDDITAARAVYAKYIGS